MCAVKGANIYRVVKITFDPLVYENVCMITIACQQRVFRRYHSEKHLSDFYLQDGGEYQLSLKLRHCRPMYTFAILWV